MNLKPLIWLVLALALAPVSALTEETPYEVVQVTANELANRIDGRQAHLEENPEELYGLIDEVLLPRFDTRYAGYLVLGKKHWRSASDEQRAQFIDAFYQFLLRSYAKAVLEFDQDKIKVISPKDTPDTKRAIVKTEMRLNDGSQVPVNYSLRNTDAGWKAYDVRIEGVSYVQNYRNQFDAEISAKGIDAVIERLENETAAKEIAQSD